MNKKSITLKDGAPILGSYSPGMSVTLGDLTVIFVTGQIARHPDGAPVAPGDFKAQTEFIFQKIVAILEEAGASINDVVKANIYATDISRFKEISEVRNKYFANAKPASTFIEISGTVREGCEVEIEVIAIKQKAGKVKICVEVPESHADAIRAAMGKAGAGVVGNYADCSFSVKGIGRFTPQEGAHPSIGRVGKPEKVIEEQIQMVCGRNKLADVISAIKRAHPYEEPGIAVYSLEELP